MATLNQDQKSFLELALDVGAVLVIADVTWTMVFGQKPPIQAFHDLIAFLGTAAAVWIGWKMVRKNKALS